MSTWALVPVKSPARAKSRLGSLLSRSECAALASHMAADVLNALHGSGKLTGIALLTDDAQLAIAGVAADCRLMAEDPRVDWCANLQRAAAQLAGEGVRSLLVVPADLPTLRAHDVRRLLSAQRRFGLTVCPAARDGGTNALLATPPDAVEFLFGADSARRHLESAARRGVLAQRLDLPAFARDIDSADDLRWLCEQAVDCASRRYLEDIDVRRRLARSAQAACSMV